MLKATLCYNLNWTTQLQYSSETHSESWKPDILYFKTGLSLLWAYNFLHLCCKRMYFSLWSVIPAGTMLFPFSLATSDHAQGFYIGHHSSHNFAYTSQAFLKLFACPEPRTPILCACFQTLIWGLQANSGTISKHYIPANLLPLRK